MLKKEQILAIADDLGIPLSWQGYQDGFGYVDGFDLFNIKSGTTIGFKGMSIGEVKSKLITLSKSPEKLEFDTLKCYCGRVATVKISIPFQGTELHPCLCGKCTEKPAYQIIDEVLKNT